jgi:adenylate cyclase
MPGPIVVNRSSPVLRRMGLLATALLLGLLIGIAVIAVRAQGWLQVLELKAYDQALAMQQRRTPEAEAVVLVTITEADIQGLARWPLSDTRLAAVLDAIASGEPAAVGVDIFRDQPVGEGLARLNDVLARHPFIVSVFAQPSAGTIGVPPPPAVADDPTRIGFANVVIDTDGTARRGLLLMGDDTHGAVYSLPAQLAMRYLERHDIFPEPDERNPDLLKLGKGTVQRFTAYDGGYIGADDGEYQFLLDARNASTAFEVIDMWSVLEGNVPEALFKDRIVLVGVTAESVKDEFLTPGAVRPIFGVELHAQVAAQLLRMAFAGDEPARSIAQWKETAFIVLFCLLGALVGVRMHSTLAFLVIVVVGAVGLWGVGVVALSREVWIPMVPPMLAWLAAALGGVAVVASFERRERASIHRLFSRFCSREVVDEIRYQGGDLLEPGASTALQATVMFTDIVGFSTKAEALGPHRVMTWLNGYASRMMPLVYGNGGIVVRLIGDAIQAVYGAPIPRTRSEDIAEDARRAVRTALAMDAALVDYNHSRETEIEKVAMRIGIATGMAAGGVLGDHRRQEYNIHGDVVNIAARLEQLEKDRFKDDYATNRTRILVTRETLRELGDEFETEPYGELQLRNLNQSTQVYRIIGPAQHASDPPPEA